MTISDPDWTFDGMVELWQEDEQTAEPSIAAVCADSQYAWLINNAARMGAGWSFSGAFQGPAYDGALANAEQLIGESIDAVSEWVQNGEIFELADGG